MTMKLFAVQLGDGVVIGAVFRVAPGLPGLDPVATAREPRRRSVLQVVAEREIESHPDNATCHPSQRFALVDFLNAYDTFSRAGETEAPKVVVVPLVGPQSGEASHLTRVGDQARKGLSLIPSVGPQQVTRSRRRES